MFPLLTGRVGPEPRPPSLSSHPNPDRTVVVPGPSGLVHVRLEFLTDGPPGSLCPRPEVLRLSCVSVSRPLWAPTLLLRPPTRPSGL